MRSWFENKRKHKRMWKTEKLIQYKEMIDTNASVYKPVPYITDCWERTLQNFSIHKHLFFYKTDAESLIMWQWLIRENLSSDCNFHAFCHTLLRRSINSSGLSDIIWWHRSGSTLAQVMAWCLTAPSHYLNQSWLISNKDLWHSPKTNFTGSARHQSVKYPWKIFL